MHQRRVTPLSGISFDVYFSSPPRSFIQHYPDHHLDGFEVCFISIGDFLRALCGGPFTVDDEFEINPLLRLHRKVGAHFFQVTQEDIHRYRMGMSDAYIAYDQCYLFMSSFTSQLMQRRLGTKDRLNLQSSLEKESSPADFMNQLNALEVACYTMSSHMTKKPIPRSVDNCSPNAYARMTSRFLKFLLGRQTTCNSAMQSKHAFAKNVTSIPFLAICMEGYIAFHNTMFTEALLPHLNGKAQQEHIQQLNDIEHVRINMKEQEILEEEDREQRSAELKKLKKRAKKKAQKQKRQLRKRPIALANNDENSTTTQYEEDNDDDDDMSSIDIIIDKECSNSNFYFTLPAKPHNLHNLSADAPPFHPLT